MQAIKLLVSDEAYDQFRKLLKKFRKDQVEVVADENNNVIAVLLDIDTFRKIEQILEDHVLSKLIEENDEKDNLNLDEALSYYYQ